ncbi:MAG: superoxide dismutase [Candidatus Liptonbacteria bacterium]|nr:superoxide dismutase [Candidatus Liptonbacteria bacterium]
MTEHTLPKLPYAYDALEPYIDAKTMEIHYTKHHQTYINNLNTALEKHKEFGDVTAENLIKSLASIPDEIRESVRNNAGGHVNHSFFWQVMKTPGKITGPSDGLVEAMDKVFGSFDGFKDLFTKAALGRFGSGWTWLSVTSLGGLEIFSTPNQDNPLTEGLIPILGLDVWEHAYYLKYQNRRQEYIENWWHVVSWEKVEDHYQKAIEALKPARP